MADPPNTTTNNHHFVSRDSKPLTSLSSASPSPVYTAQPLPLSIAGKTPNPAPQMATIQDLAVHLPPPSPQGIIYPVASSGRGFIPLPQSANQLVTVANSGGFPPRAVVSFQNQVRHFGFHHPDPKGHPIQLRPPHLQPTRFGSREVRLSDGASLYALCRSWVQNGLPQEIQPQLGECVKLLPRPLPMTDADIHAPKRNEGDDENEEKEEDGGSVEDLSARDLLRRHIKRGKKVQARLKEQRLHRIARYKQRLALLLPPPVEQFKNDSTNGN